MWDSPLCLGKYREMGSSKIDPNGMFVIFIGQINSLPVMLVNIYDPNTDDPALVSKGFGLIPDDDLSHKLTEGFNCYLDPYLAFLCFST